MIDTEHDSLDWAKILSWLFVAMMGVFWWWSLFVNGFFTTIVWTIVITAAALLWNIVKDTRG